MVDLSDVPEGATHYAHHKEMGRLTFYRLDRSPAMAFDQIAGKWFASAFATNDEVIAMYGESIKEIPMKKEESDLDWLVRETNGVWPDGDKGIARLGDMKVSTPHPELVYFCPRWYTKDEYLCRKAELQNKPSWSSAEADAEWMAQRPDGKWGFFSVKPSTDNRGWTHEGGYAWMSGNCGEVLGDWRDTLERRPAESVAATQQKSYADGWFERGELPPIGTVCEVLWNEGRMEYLRTKVFGVNEHGHPIHRFDEGPKKFEYQADPMVTILGTTVFRPLPTERQRTITGMVDIMIETPVNDNQTATERLTAVASAIYDKFISKQGGGA
jgi:hypothetical protein